MYNPFTTKDPLFDSINQVMLGEKKLTDAEMKKREEIAQAMERENPGMDMGKKMAIATDQAKKVAEEADQIDEISKKTTGSYLRKATVDFARRHSADSIPGKEYDEAGIKNFDKMHDRASGINRAIKKLTKEEVNLDEASYNKDSEHHKNARKAAKSMSGKATYHPNGNASVSFQDVVHGRSTVNPKGTVLSTGEKDAERASKSHGGKAVGNVVHFKEEVNLDEQLENFWGTYTTMFNEAEDQQQTLLLRAMAKDPSDLMKMKRALKMGDKALTNPVLRQEILKMLDQMMNLTTTDKSLLQRTRMGFQKAKRLPKDLPIDEAIKKAPFLSKDGDGSKTGNDGNIQRDVMQSRAYVAQIKHIKFPNKPETQARADKDYNTALDKIETTPVYKFLQTRKGDGTVHTEEVAKDAPFEGGREVKSTKSAAERVKKIAKGMEKRMKDKK